jgi:hypothetical protein
VSVAQISQKVDYTSQISPQKSTSTRGLVIGTNEAGGPGQAARPKRLAGKQGRWAILTDVYTLTTHIFVGAKQS